MFALRDSADSVSRWPMTGKGPFLKLAHFL